MYASQETSIHDHELSLWIAIASSSLLWTSWDWENFHDPGFIETNIWQQKYATDGARIEC